MKVIWLVLKKELQDIIRNRRRLFMIILFNFILLPLLSIVPMFFIARRTVNSVVQTLQVPVQGMEYAPQMVAYIEAHETMKLVPTENVEKQVVEKQAAVGMIVPSDFEKKIASGASASVIVVMDKSKSLNVEGERVKNILEKYNQSLLDDRLKQSNLSEAYLNPITVEEHNTATTAETTGSYLSLLIPGFIITFGLTNGLSVAIGTIAGEKDRQTLEPVLFTPVNRVHLILGKMAAVLANVLFSAFSFLMTILLAAFLFLMAAIFIFKNTDITPLTSAPAMVAPAVVPTAGIGGYAPSPIAILLFVLSVLPIIVLGASVQIMISSLARNSEEAYTYSLPLSIFSIAPMVAAFFLDEFVPSLWHYTIPIFGTILSMRDLLSGHIYAGSLAIMFVSSAAYAVLTVAVAVWMFNREEVLFRT